MVKIVVMLVLIFSNFLFASVGFVKTLTGKVELKKGKKIVMLKVGSSLENGDVIITKKESSIGMVFDDGTTISLGEKATFVINIFKVKPEKNEFDIDVFLKKGKAVFTSGKIGKLSPKSVKFRIPEGIIGIRGTHFAVEAK